MHDGHLADDAVALRCAAKPASDLLFDPCGALCYSNAHFTPLLPISFKLDRLLSGIDPVGGRIQNLIAAAVLAALALRLFAGWVPLALAALLVMTWIVSPPFTATVGWLVTRQWVWGLSLSLLALEAFRKWQQGRRATALVAALVLYGAALLWKDVFLPLPAVALVVGRGTPVRRALDAAPFVAVAAAYLAWRTWMLGGLGGYGEFELSIGSIAVGIARSAPVTFEELFGLSWIWFVPLALVGLRRGASFAAIWALVVAPIAFLFPSSPVAALPLRYLFPVTLVAFAAVAVAAGRLGRTRPAAIALVALASGAGIAHGLPRSLEVLDELRRAGEEGRDVVRFLETTDCADVVLVGLASTPQWFASAMHAIHHDERRRSFARATVVGGVAALASPALVERADRECGVFAYEAGAFRRETGTLGERIEAWLGARNGVAPVLEVDVRGSAIDLRWTSVPDAERYLLFYGEEPDLYAAALPVAGRFYPARNLPAGEYCFRVAARRRGGEIGRLSDETCVRTPSR